MKADADQIARFMAALPRAVALDKAREWWPRFVFRSDHVEHTAEILNSGSLLSRARAEAQGVIVVDAADPALISGLDPDDRQWARLYFRPRAPTQHANEGVRPASKIQYGAHMPVPVYLVFGAAEVLGQDGVLFTKGRMTSHDVRGGDVEFLRSMNWRWVYHDSQVGRCGAADRAHILNARHSEVLVPDELGLDHLKWVVCRSPAERQTLLQCLSNAARARWGSRVRLEGATRMFFKRGTFVQDVSLSSREVRLYFYALTLGHGWRGPFELRVDIETDDGRLLAYRQDGFYAGTDPLRLAIDPPAAGYVVRVTMDQSFVLAVRHDRADEPTVFP